MITSGDINEDNKILIKNAHSSKDNYLSDERLEKHTQSLRDVCRALMNEK